MPFPTELGLQLHGIKAGYLRWFQDFDVGDEVTPVDVEDGAEAVLMEVSEELQVVTIGDPRLGAIPEGGQNNGSVHIYLMNEEIPLLLTT